MRQHEMISLHSNEAKKLSNPSASEELTRYENEVSEAITEAATAGIKEITLRIPMYLRDDIIRQLHNLGYSYTAIKNEERMSFFRVNWL
jgi:RNA processing factor Prp31